MKPTGFCQSINKAMLEQVTPRLKSITFGRAFHTISHCLRIIAFGLAFAHLESSFDHYNRLQYLITEPQHDSTVCIRTMVELHLELSRNLEHMDLYLSAMLLFWFIRVLGPIMLDVTRFVGTGLKQEMLGTWLDLTRCLWPQLMIETIDYPQGGRDSSTLTDSAVASRNGFSFIEEAQESRASGRRRLPYDSFVRDDPDYGAVNTSGETTSTEDAMHILTPLTPTTASDDTGRTFTSSSSNSEQASSSLLESRPLAHAPMVEQRLESAIAAQASAISSLERRVNGLEEWEEWRASMGRKAKERLDQIVKRHPELSLSHTGSLSSCSMETP